MSNTLKAFSKDFSMIFCHIFVAQPWAYGLDEWNTRRIQLSALSFWRLVYLAANYEELSSGLIKAPELLNIFISGLHHRTECLLFQYAKDTELAAGLITTWHCWHSVGPCTTRDSLPETSWSWTVTNAKSYTWDRIRAAIYADGDQITWEQPYKKVPGSPGGF